MANTDFFDDDLRADHAATPPVAIQKPVVDAADLAADEKAEEMSISRLNRHRDQVEGQVASTVRDIERLRQRQEDLERERQELEGVRARQDEYEVGKRKIIHQLNESLLALEKEEVRSTQLAELYGATRSSFKEMLMEVEGIDERKWSQETLFEELEQSQLVIDSIRVECSKSLAKVDAISSEARPQAPEAEQAGVDDTHSPGLSFGYWLKVGAAISIPVFVALVVYGLLINYLITSFFQ